MRVALFNGAITAAQALAAEPGSQFLLVDAPTSVCVQANFTYGSGGTSVDAYLQTSVDNGATWVDIVHFGFTTTSARVLYNLNSQTVQTTAVVAKDGALTVNTAQDGILGPLYQVKLVTVGTYAATTLRIDVSAQEP